MWGWLDSLLGGLKSIWQSITELPEKLVERLLEGLRGFFVPDTVDIKNRFDLFLTDISERWAVDTEFFETLFDDEKTVENIGSAYWIPNIGTMWFDFVDVRFLIQGVEFFRPFIRGFLVLLMAIYNIRQLLSFIRQDAGVMSGKGVESNSPSSSTALVKSERGITKR